MAPARGSGRAPHGASHVATRLTLLLPLLLLLLAAACCATAAGAAVPLSAWKKGRSTYYGHADGSSADTWNQIDKGGCGYYALPRKNFPYGFVAGIVQSDRLDMYTGQCGSCYEIMCDSAGSWSPPEYGNPCAASSVVVQVTDACPCHYPGNQASNSKWCCGDMAHFDLSSQAFEQLAPTALGSIYVRYRRVACDFAGPVRVMMDTGSSPWYLAVRLLAVGDAGALASVEVRQDSSGGGGWRPMAAGWGATWSIQSTAVAGWDAWGGARALAPPLSLRLTARLTGSVLVLPGVVTSLRRPAGVGGPSDPGAWQFASGQQFPPPTGAAAAPGPLAPGGRTEAVASFLYHDALSPGWTDASWGASVDYANWGQGHGGGTCIKATLSRDGGLGIATAGAGVRAGGGARLQLWLSLLSGACTLARPGGPTASLALLLEGPGDPSTLQVMARHINRYRCMHGSPPLTWHIGLAADTAAYAQSCRLRPSGLAGYGELAARGAATAAGAVAGWYNSKSAYDFSRPGAASNAAAGAFSQLVWAGTTTIGCGVGWCGGLNGGAGGLQFVCRFAQPGNVAGPGGFSANVRPAVLSSAACAAAQTNAVRYAVGPLGLPSTPGGSPGAAVLPADPRARPWGSNWTRVSVDLAGDALGQRAWTKLVLKNASGRGGCTLLLDEVEVLAPATAGAVSL